MAVDTHYVYWANETGIGRASVDGTGLDQTLIPNRLVAVGVAVNAGHLFWTTVDIGNQTGWIGRANVDGTGVDQRFITGVTRPLGLAATFTRPEKVPTAGATPSKLDFGNQPVSTLGPPSVLTVKNTGTAPLKISSVRVSSGDVDDFGPTVRGTRPATLSLVSNDPASPLKISLSGVGTAT